jgi:hypothetical protein
VVAAIGPSAVPKIHAKRSRSRELASLRNHSTESIGARFADGAVRAEAQEESISIAAVMASERRSIELSSSGYRDSFG